MRSAMLCVFFTLIILKRIHALNGDFRPTPIPLSDWHHDRREGRALHDTFRAEPAVAAVPAHYWEDALRHSVYLTLVRDKIDQLIAKGQDVSANSKPGGYDSKEIDDHDLWDKVKTAPFYRIQQEEPGAFGDVTIMAKGRLLEDEEGFRFAEDERSKEKCSENDCLRDVKAFWSVKRVRQRDVDTSLGKYPYELTFSVISQMPKKQRKPYENPIRTFTVKESFPNGVLDRPQEYRQFGQALTQTSRPARAIWIHKNISPAKQTGRKHYFDGLDRIFSSFFSEDEENAYDAPPPKYKPNPFVTPAPPLYSKIGLGVPNEHYQQIPHPYRPHLLKHVRPPLQAPPVHPIQHQYLDMGVITAPINSPYAPYSHDYRVESSQTVKTTRPAVLPTPLPHKSQSSEVTNMMSIEGIENTSLSPDTTVIHKTYSKYKTTPTKLNYFSDHVRPPIYNAPPGVFVTMDKKPFKPMPPLKLKHPTKSHRPNRPTDFRPSPQITDVQSSDYFADSAFRPITMNFGDSSAPEKVEVIETTKKGEQNKTRKPTTGKKPPKKHSDKPQRTTTATPDIITAKSTSEEEIETMDWANILGAFTKTTPMASQTEKTHVTEATTPMTTTTTETTTRPRSTTTTAAPQETTTAKPKRTRPPAKYVKQDKIKKHKRLTTTTTLTSTTSEIPENIVKNRISHDLTPQASSAATGVPRSTKPHRESHNKTQTTTSTTTTSTTITTTTTKPITIKTTTTTTQSPSTTTKSTVSTTQSRSKNRFRQSTLKGTSIKHGRWNGGQNNQTVTTPYTSYNNRRKGSNFHGYISSTTPHQNVEDRERNHEDRKPSSSTEPVAVRTTPQTNAYYDEAFEQYETNSVIPLEHADMESDENYEDDSKDHSEFIFQPTTTQSSLQVITTPYTPVSNKTKCKKKKTNISTTQETNDDAETFDTTPKPYTVTTTKISTEVPTTSNILEEFLNFNFSEDDVKDPSHASSSSSRGDLLKEESSNHESYLKIDDIEDFLDMHLSDKKKLLDDDIYGNNDDEDDDVDDDDSENDEDDEEYENSKIPSIDDDTVFQPDNDEKQKTDKHSNIEEGRVEKRPYTFLELMAMS